MASRENCSTASPRKYKIQLKEKQNMQKEFNQTVETIKPKYYPSLEKIKSAAENLRGVANHTPLSKNLNLSLRYKANILLKREDLQIVRSYKIRGAYNKISSLSPTELSNGVVCASAGNHAQGVAFSCAQLEIPGTIFMPVTTPKQKIKQVKMFGKQYVEIVLKGDTFDDAYEQSLAYAKKNHQEFIKPFDDEKVIEGQGTVGLEILEASAGKIDYLIIPVGGGGLAAGVGSVFKYLSPATKIIGVEPSGAPAMSVSFEQGEIVTLHEIDKFVDGAAVKRVGELTFNICKEVLDDMVIVDEGKICSTILQLYDEEALVAEPAGALSIAVLDSLKNEIENKNVVCILSGSNNDITRMEEIKERSLLYERLKHYFIIRFPQRAGALKEFVNNVLGKNDDITLFEYRKKHNRENGPALVGIELQSARDFETLLLRLEQSDFIFEYLNEKGDLFQHLIL
jgi:threonine dehydratase